MENCIVARGHHRLGFRVAVHPDDTVRYVRDHSGFPVSGPLEDVRNISHEPHELSGTHEHDTANRSKQIGCVKIAPNFKLLSSRLQE